MIFPRNSVSPVEPTFEQLRAGHAASALKSAVNELFELYGQLSAPFQALLGRIFAQPGVWHAFMHGPSSLQGHHCGRGGNLRHSVDVARISLMLADDPAAKGLVDRDVQIVAALLHALGKALEYEASWYGTKMSLLGRLVGHKFTGFGMVWSCLDSVPGISEAQRAALLNCLSNSVHGAASGARGPACLEAQILSHADQFSASSDLFRASQAASKTDAGFGVRHPHQRETPYHVKPRSLAPTLAALTKLATPTKPAAQRPSLRQRLEAATKASNAYFLKPRRV